jgi:transcriptional regulator with XRE-family HTH domain
MTAKKYKKLRKSLGTQREVAELLGVTRGLIGLRETRKANITMEASIAMLSIIKINEKQS